MVRIGWLGVVVGLVGCSGAPKGDDTDLPTDSDAADTDVIDSDVAADTDVADTDAVDTDVDGDADGSGASVDCDDGNPSVHPGAAERCNGLDDDCDPLTLEDGLATWVGDDGTVRALDQEWAVGVVTLDQPGTVTLCTGAFRGDTVAQADTVFVGAGRYDESAGTGTLLQPPDSAYVVSVSPSATLTMRDMTLRGALDSMGILCSDATVTLERVSIEGFDSPGIEAERSSVWLQNVYLLDNAVGDGVVKVSGGTLTADALVAARNSGQAAAVLRLSALTYDAKVTNSEFRENTSGEGAVRLLTANAGFDSTTFASNTGTKGAAVNAEGSEVRFTSVDLSNNSADEGGAVYAQDGSLSFSATSLLDNVSSGAGGAVSSYGTTITVSDDSHVERNQADGHGGAIACEGGALTATGGQWIMNHADGDGGAVFNHASCALTLTDFFAGANTSDAKGGFMYALNAGFTIDASHFQDNMAAHGGTLAARAEDGGRHDGWIADSTVMRTSATAGPGVMDVSASDGGVALQVQRSDFRSSSSVGVGGILLQIGGASSWVEADFSDDSFVDMGERSFTLDGSGVLTLDLSQCDFPNLGQPDFYGTVRDLSYDFGFGTTSACAWDGCD